MDSLWLIYPQGLGNVLCHFKILVCVNKVITFCLKSKVYFIFGS